MPGDRMVGEAPQQVDVTGRAAYWKLPTRRWLLATRASTAPGSSVSRRTVRPVATTAKDRVVGMPRACIASLTMYSRSIGLPRPGRRPTGERRAARTLEVHVADAAVGVGELAEQECAPVA